MLLISSYSLEKADVNYRVGALCALELNCCTGSKLPGGSPGDAHSRRCLISTMRIQAMHIRRRFASSSRITCSTRKRR